MPLPTDLSPILFLGNKIIPPSHSFTPIEALPVIDVIQVKISCKCQTQNDDKIKGIHNEFRNKLIELLNSMSNTSKFSIPILIEAMTRSDSTTMSKKATNNFHLVQLTDAPGVYLITQMNKFRIQVRKIVKASTAHQENCIEEKMEESVTTTNIKISDNHEIVAFSLLSYDRGYPGASVVDESIQRICLELAYNWNPLWECKYY